MLAASPFSVMLAAGLAAELAVGALDAVTGAAALISALLVLPPLVVSLTGRWGDTAVIVLVALALVLVKPVVSTTTEFHHVAIPLLLVLLGGAVAIAVALVRAATAIALARFGLLMRLADAVEAARGPEELIDEVLDLVVPGMGDIAMIDAMIGGEPRRLGVRGALGVPPQALEAIRRRRPVPAGLARTAEAAMAAGRSLLVTGISTDLIAEAAAEPGDERALRALRPRTAVVVPLRARGRTFGALTCATGPSGRRHWETDRLFAEVLGDRLALALDNAGLTRELSEAEEMHGVVVDALAEAVTVTDAAGSMVYANEAAVRLLRADTVEELLARPPGRDHGALRGLRRGGRGAGARGLPGEPAAPRGARRPAVAGAQRHPRDGGGTLAAAEGLRAARPRGSPTQRRQRDRGRHHRQARRARPAAARARQRGARGVARPARRTAGAGRGDRARLRAVRRRRCARARSHRPIALAGDELRIRRSPTA